MLLERDDLAAAAEHLAVSERLGDHNGLPQNPYRWRVVTARLREAEGDLDGALELLDEADRVYEGDYSPNVRPVPAVRARLRLRRGELGAAAAWAREQGAVRRRRAVVPARVRARHPRPPAAGAARRPGRPRPAASGCWRRPRTASAAAASSSCSCCWPWPITAAATPRRALAALDRALTLAEPEGYVRVFVDEGPPMAALLKASLRRVRRPGLRAPPAGRDVGRSTARRPSGRRSWTR